jgi:hypothetical protein
MIALFSIVFAISLLPSLVYSFYFYHIKFIHKFHFKTDNLIWLRGIHIKDSEEEILKTENESLIKEYYLLRRIENINIFALPLMLISYALIIYLQ